MISGLTSIPPQQTLEKYLLMLILKKEPTNNHTMNYKNLMYVTIALGLVNLVIGIFTDFWGDSNWADYINSILVILLVLFGTQVFSKKK